MNKLKTLIILLLLNHAVVAQSELDSIFTTNGKLAVNIKEITEDAVKFSYPNEDLVNSIYKNTIFNIKHKSGRLEVFNETSSFKPIKGGADWENVSITRVETELKGLFKLEEVTSKATGATSFSNVNTVKDRAFKKLKIETAMVGGNTVYIIDQTTNGVRNGGYGADPARTNLSGVAYSNARPNFEEFSTLLNTRNEFSYAEYHYLGNNSTDLETGTPSQETVILTNPRNESGFIMVQADISGENTEEYRVTYVDNETIILMYRDKKKVYNIILKR